MLFIESPTTPKNLIGDIELSSQSKRQNSKLFFDIISVTFQDKGVML